MRIVELLSQYPPLFWLLVSLFGLIIGSFLGAVTHRLPRMLEQTEGDRYNLLWPRSHCPRCTRTLTWPQLFPLLSFIALRGRCAACHTAIHWRYPLIEATTAGLILICAWHYGVSVRTLAAMLFSSLLLALTVIDLEHQLLPDELTLPGIWLGLLCNTLMLWASPTSAILGACLGYSSLWLIYVIFKAFTGREGLGFGDFKCLALLGAWLGWEALPQVVLIASALGTLIALIPLCLNGYCPNRRIPFGPFLAIAGWIDLLYGDTMTAVLSKYIGIV